MTEDHTLYDSGVFKETQSPESPLYRVQVPWLRTKKVLEGVLGAEGLCGS